MTFHVACSEDGLAEAPKLTRALPDHMVTGCEQAHQVGILTDMSVERDRAIVGVRKAVANAKTENTDT